MNQYQIEQYVGIDNETAIYMMKKETSAAKNAMSLLKMCVDFFESGSLALLQEAVNECKKEIKEGK